MSIGEMTDLTNMFRNALASLIPTMEGGTADPRDELIVRYTRGRGRFSADKQFITLDMKMFTLSGEEDGTHHGVWQALFKSPQELLRVPPTPKGPMDVPVGPVPHINPIAQTKAIWSFTDGSSLTVVGPAVSHLIPLQDGSFIFMVSTAQVVTSGTGRYEGAIGVNQSLGATYVPAGADFFGAGSSTFDATTLDTFKVARRRYNRPFVASGSPLIDTSATSAKSPSPANSSTPASVDSPSVDKSSSGQEEISSAYRFSTKQIEVRKSMMSYIDEGTGDPVLFLHGNPAWSYVWRNIIPRISPLARCIAPDLIGMGRSEKPYINYSFQAHYDYLEEFIQKLGLDRITLVAQEWGSALGFHYAKQHPEKVRALAFMEAILTPYATWDEFPSKSAPQLIRDAFRAYRSEKGFDLVVKQNIFLARAHELAGRPLTREETAAYDNPFQTERSREVILQWVRDLPIEGQPASVAREVDEYSRYLCSSEVPKLLLYTYPGVILLKEQVDWCKQNLSHLETVNLDPKNSQIRVHLLAERYPRKIGETIANWYQGFSG